MLDIQQYQPKPHPLKKEFQRLQISQIVLSNFLRKQLHIRTSQSRISQWLNGYDPIPEHIETELQNLLSKISSQGAEL
jgi:hypothetical protein